MHPVCHLPPQVVAVGEGKEDEETKQVVKPNVAVGATVMYSKYSGTEFEVRAGAREAREEGAAGRGREQVLGGSGGKRLQECAGTSNAATRRSAPQPASWPPSPHLL